MPQRFLLIGVIGLASGIFVRSLFIFPPAVFGFCGLLGILFLFAWFFLNRNTYLGVGVFLVLAALGAGRTALAPATLPESFVPLLSADVSLEGTVVVDPDIRETTQRLTLEVPQGGETTRVLAVVPLYPEVVYGERLRVSGVLQKPEPFATDGGREFRYDRFLAKDKIFAIMPRASFESVAPPMGVSTRVFGALFSARHIFVRGLQATLQEPYAALASGLIAGGKQGLGKALLEAFTVSGLLPIVVLSGYNVMIVAEAILRALGFLPKRRALLFAAIGIAAFVLAAGAGASAIRAGLMALVALFARATGRTYDALRALVAVLVLMLLWNPLLLAYDPGFQFSFVATLGIILMAPLFELRLLRIKNGFVRDLLATTLAAQLFVLPLLLYHTGNLSLVAIPANMLVLPVVPFAMLLAFIAGVVALLIPPVAPFVGLPAYALLWYIVTVAKFSAALTLAHVIVPAFSSLFVVLAYALIALFYHHLKKKRQP